MGKGKKLKKLKVCEDQREMLAKIDEFINSKDEVNNLKEGKPGYGYGDIFKHMKEEADAGFEKPSFIGAFKPCEESEDTNFAIPSDPYESEVSYSQSDVDHYMAMEEAMSKFDTDQSAQKTEDKTMERFEIQMTFNKMILQINDSHKTVSIDLNGYCDRLDDIIPYEDIVEEFTDDDAENVANLIRDVILPKLYPTYVWDQDTAKGRIKSMDEGRNMNYYVGSYGNAACGYIVSDECLEAFTRAYIYGKYYMGEDTFCSVIQAIMMLYPYKAIAQYAYRHIGDETPIDGKVFMHHVLTVDVVDENNNPIEDSWDFVIDPDSEPEPDKLINTLLMEAAFPHEDDYGEYGESAGEVDEDDEESILDESTEEALQQNMNQVVENVKETTAVEEPAAEPTEPEEKLIPEAEPVKEFPSVTFEGKSVSDYEEAEEEEVPDIFNDEEEYEIPEKPAKVPMPKKISKSDDDDTSFVVKRRN